MDDDYVVEPVVWISRTSTRGGLVVLAMFSTVLICLTVWQGWADSTTIFPRDLEPWGNDKFGDGGQMRSTRNARLAGGILALCSCFFVFVMYWGGFQPLQQQKGYYCCAIILFAAALLATICFFIDASSTGKIVTCTTEVSLMTKTCLPKPALGVLVALCDVLISVFGFVNVTILVLWRKRGTFLNNPTSDCNRRTSIDVKLLNAQSSSALPNHKKLVFAFSAVIMCVAILQLASTLLIHELRERVVGPEWDPISNQTKSGWKYTQTPVHMIWSCIALGLCLAVMIPLPGGRGWVRVNAYGMLCSAVAHYVCGVMALLELRAAKRLECPPRVVCTFARYNALVAFCFINGTINLVVTVLLIRDPVEHTLCEPGKHTPSTVAQNVCLEQNPSEAALGCPVPEVEAADDKCKSSALISRYR